MATSSSTIETPSIASVGPTGSDWALLCGCVLLWGSTFAGLTLASRTIDPVWIIAGRLLIATALLAGPTWLEARRRIPPSGPKYAPISWRAVLSMSLVGTLFTALPYLAYADAARTTPSSVLAICNGAAPIFTMLLAHFLLPNDRMTPRRAIGVALGFTGLVLLVSPRLREGVTASSTALVLTIVAAGLYAVGNIVARQAPRIRPIASSFILVSSGAVAATFVALIAAPIPVHASQQSLLALLGVGVGPTGVAMIAWVLLVQRAGPVFTSFATYISPLVALAIGVIFLHEHPGWEALAALALILSGVAVANLAPRPPRTREAAAD